MSLRWRIALAIAALVATTSLVLTLVFHQAVMADHEHDHLSWAATLSNALAKAILRDTLEDKRVEVAKTLKRVMNANPDLAYLVAVGFDGKPLADTLDGQLPPELAHLDHRNCRAGSSLSLRMGQLAVHDIAYPVVEKLDAHLHVGLNEAAFTRSVNAATLKTVLAASFILLLALAAAIAFARRISRPLTQLTDSVEAFGRGEAFDKQRIPGGDAEVRKLVGSFDRMARERQEADAALRRTQFCLDRAPDGVFWLDREGRAIYANEQACQALGYSKDELIGMRVWDFDPDFPAAKWPEQWETLRNRGVRIFETRHRHKNGKIFPVEISSVHMTYGDIDLHVAFVRDIGERKRIAEELHSLNLELEKRVEKRTSELAVSNKDLQSALETLRHAQDELVRSEKLAALGSLVAGVAHELNTPLGNSVTVATTLADRVRQFNEEVASGNVRRSSLADFVDFSQKASAILTSSLFTASDLISHFKQVAVDQTSEQRRPFDLGEVVAELAMTLQPQFKKTPHQLHIAIPEGIRMDSFPGPLGQVITNLVSNALIHAFADHPGGRIRIEASATDNHVDMVVSDNGKGIPPENLAHIFDPFFTTRLGQGGSGLGLHIVYSIVVRVLGGRITATSEPGQGTVFTLQLPLRAQETASSQLGEAIAITRKQDTP